MAASVDNAQLDKKIKQWLEWDKNEKTRKEINDLVKEKNAEKLTQLLDGQMSFGTAGIRGNMGAGFTQMNDVTIIQTTQGLRAYMAQLFPGTKYQGVVIGYDARHNSRRWAHLAAAVFLSHDMSVYLFSDVVPTPFVPYSVLHLKCNAGIMITASHNPKNDNGYKVYWMNGAQIIPPHDKEIAASIEKNSVPQPESWNEELANKHPKRHNPLWQVMKNYFSDLQMLSVNKDNNKSTPLKFTYTAMHGVGYKYIVEAYKSTNFPAPIPVVEQIDPDPEFPTVKFPNPEEGKSALNLSVATAEKNGSTVIIANDPDADRLAVAEKQKNGEWKVFSGNELGALFGWWLWKCYRQKHPNKSASDVWMISSTVSSMILKAIANKEGFNHVDTLTGFKWMANKADELLQQNKTVLFAFEEAIGFMCGTRVLDKDGISAAIAMSEMATVLSTEGKTIQQQLDIIYDTYGYHVSNNSYFICHHQPTIDSMFNRIRNWDGKEKTYPQSCGKYAIKYIRDLTVGYDDRQPDNKPLLPVSSSSHMITFYFHNGTVATIRTSGTEPKIKYYTEMCADPETGMDRTAIEAELNDLVACIVRHFYEPERNNFTARTT